MLLWLQRCLPPPRHPLSCPPPTPPPSLLPFSSPLRGATWRLDLGVFQRHARCHLQAAGLGSKASRPRVFWAPLRLHQGLWPDGTTHYEGFTVGLRKTTAAPPLLPPHCSAKCHISAALASKMSPFQYFSHDYPTADEETSAKRAVHKGSARGSSAVTES